MPNKLIHNRFSENVETRLSRLTTTIDKAPIGIAHVSPSGHWLMVNRHLCDMLGYTEPELTRKTFQDLTYAPDLAQDLRHVERMLNGEISSYSMEKRYLRKDGSLIWGRLSVSLIRDQNGAPEYFISVVEDISSRKQMEEDLQRSKQRLQLFRALPGVASWELNLDSGKCEWSEETYKLMEQDRSVQPSLDLFLGLIHPEDRNRVHKAIDEAITGKKEYNVEFRIIPPSKKVKYIVARGRVFYNLGNPVLSGVAWEGRLRLKSLGYSALPTQPSNQG